MLKGVKSIDKELSKKYKNFIKDKNFTQNENKSTDDDSQKLLSTRQSTP